VNQVNRDRIRPVGLGEEFCHEAIGLEDREVRLERPVHVLLHRVGVDVPVRDAEQLRLRAVERTRVDANHEAGDPRREPDVRVDVELPGSGVEKRDARLTGRSDVLLERQLAIGRLHGDRLVGCRMVVGDEIERVVARVRVGLAAKVIGQAGGAAARPRRSRRSCWS
jgi:hypothetical protein